MGNDTTNIHAPEVQQSLRALIAQVKVAAGFEPGFTHTSDELETEYRGIDVYGYDVYRNLAVIGIRKAWLKKGFQFAKTRRVYALVGLDDAGQIFSYPMASSPCRNPRMIEMDYSDVVKWAESKIFGVPVAKLDRVIRQRHIALAPVPYRPEDAIPVKRNTLCVPGGYQVKVEGMLYRHAETDVLYADGFITIAHTKSPHEALSCEGRCKILVGKLAGDPWWAAAARIGD
jgi:hypothetical protein